MKSVLSISVRNFFAAAQMDVSDRVIDKVIGALNSVKLAALGQKGMELGTG